MVSAATLRIPNCDRLIALKFPTYLVPHDDVVVWLLHQFRQVYDLWDQDTGWPDGRREREVRTLVHGADRAALTAAQAVYCNSAVTQARLAQHLGLEAEVLLPPLLQDEGFTSGPYGDYLLATGRISKAKRQDLAVEAMGLPPGAGRLVVAGPPDSEEDARRLRNLVADHDLSDRVEVLDEFISEGHKRELLARARAVVYLPVDEDSYGYVTLEAAHASRPVITAADSGGTLALVEDGATGLVVAPEAPAVAAAFAALLGDEQHAAKMGATLHDRCAGPNALLAGRGQQAHGVRVAVVTPFDERSAVAEVTLRTLAPLRDDWELQLWTHRVPARVGPRCPRRRSIP